MKPQNAGERSTSLKAQGEVKKDNGLKR